MHLSKMSRCLLDDITEPDGPVSGVLARGVFGSLGVLHGVMGWRLLTVSLSLSNSLPSDAELSSLSWLSCECRGEGGEYSGVEC